MVKRDVYTEESNSLQTPAEVDLKARSDFAFAASVNWFEQRYAKSFPRSSAGHAIPGLSNNFLYCAVALIGEVKATSH